MHQTMGVVVAHEVRLNEKAKKRSDRDAAHLPLRQDKIADNWHFHTIGETLAPAKGNLLAG